MPRAAKTSKPDPAKVYCAWTRVALDGIPGVVQQGERRRGDDPAVMGASWAFVLAGAPESEWPTSHDEVAERHDREHPVPDHDVSVRTYPLPLEQEVVVLNKKLRVLVQNTGQVHVFEPGTRFRANETLAATLPAAFDRETRASTRGLRAKGRK